MTEQINEPIDVLASFINGRVSPKGFLWRNRKYDNLKIEGMRNTWEKGFRKVKFLVGTDQINFYEITFNAQNVQWELEKIHHAG